MRFLVCVILSFISINAMELDYFSEFVTSQQKVEMANKFRSSEETITQLFQNNKNTNLDFSGMNSEFYGMNIRTIIREMLSKNANVSFPNITKECRDIGNELISPITNIPIYNISARIAALLGSPLGLMLDAFGKLPERVLMLNTQFLGAYDECAELNNTKYCVTSVTFFAKSQITYGSCFPKQCTANDVNEILSTLNNITKGLLIIPPDATLCEKPTDYSTGVVSTISIMIIIVFLCVVGTLTEILTELSASRLRRIELIYANQGVENQSSESNEFDNTTTIVIAKDQIDNTHSDAANKENVISLRLPSANVEGKVSGNCLTNFLTSFSLIKNTKAILATHVADGSITSINGIRVISLTWVILGHLFILMMAGPPDNILKMMNNVIHRFTFVAVGNAYPAVDSFFLLSGLLVSYLTLKRIANKGMGCADISMFYLHRYIRLSPPLGLTILFYTNILPIILSGPKGVVFSQTDTLTKPCYDSWWSTILYFNNFYPENSGGMCLGWTWYLSNDMQFYILSPPLLLLMVAIEKRCKSRRRGILLNFILIMSLCVVSMIVTGIITGVYDIPSLITSIMIPNNPRVKQTAMIMDRIYAKPYCRVGPYLIGIFLGYLFSRNVTLSDKTGTRVAVAGWLLSIVLGLAVVYGPWHVFKENGTFFSDAENTIYAACNRCAWGVAVAWVVYACHNKLGGLVNEFLSWRLWIPLSRLTYGAYLLHFIVIEYFVFTKDIPNHYQDSSMVFDFISVTVVSYASAFVLAVCVEYPVFNLERKLLKR